MGGGEARAQVFLGRESRRTEEEVEQRIDALRARARCLEQHATSRQQTWVGQPGNAVSAEARATREVQWADADQQLRDCLGQLEAPRLRQVCPTTARTEGQRARCYQ